MPRPVLRKPGAADRRGRHNELRARYEAFRAKNVKLDITRGKPSAEQLDLSAAMLSLPGPGDYRSVDGWDCRNYFGSTQGLPEAHALLSGLVGATPERLIGAGTSAPARE